MKKNAQYTGSNGNPVAPTTARQFTRRIGTTTYRVSVHFSETSKETMNDKITRMIKNETAVGA